MSGEFNLSMLVIRVCLWWQIGRFGTMLVFVCLIAIHQLSMVHLQQARMKRFINVIIFDSFVQQVPLRQRNEKCFGNHRKNRMALEAQALNRLETIACARCGGRNVFRAKYFSSSIIHQMKKRARPMKRSQPLPGKQFFE